MLSFYWQVLRSHAALFEANKSLLRTLLGWCLQEASVNAQTWPCIWPKISESEIAHPPPTPPPYQTQCQFESTHSMAWHAVAAQHVSGMCTCVLHIWWFIVIVLLFFCSKAQMHFKISLMMTGLKNYASIIRPISGTANTEDCTGLWRGTQLTSTAQTQLSPTCTCHCTQYFTRAGNLNTIRCGFNKFSLGIGLANIAYTGCLSAPVCDLHVTQLRHQAVIVSFKVDCIRKHQHGIGRLVYAQPMLTATAKQDLMLQWLCLCDKRVDSMYHLVMVKMICWR